MAQDVGDAVLHFLGDSTDLDTKFDKVGPDAEKAFGKAADAVEEGTGRMKTSMGEARGEAALLGEAFGIHLPRHVRSFLAELPGVNQALSAAFSATAVLFLLQAVAQAAEKISTFVSDNLILTDTMKAQNAEIANSNEAINKLNEQRQAAIEKLNELQGATKEYEAAEMAATRATYEGVKANYDAALAQSEGKSKWQASIDVAKDLGTSILNLIPGVHLLSSEEQEHNRVMSAGNSLVIARVAEEKALTEEKKVAAEERRQAGIREQLTEVENQKKIALAYARNDQDKYEIELHFGERRLALLKELGDKEKSAVEAQLAQIEVLQIVHEQKISAAFVNLLKSVQAAKEQALDAMKDSVVENTIALSPMAAAFQKGADAAHSMGVTLRTDLVVELEKAKKAMKDFLASGITDPVAFKALDTAIKNADKDLKNFGNTEEKFKNKTENTWKNFQFELNNGAHAMQNLSELGTQAFDSMALGLQGAIATAILAQGSFVQALEKATAQALTSLASQALVKALFYTAEGFAALASFNGTSAGQYFAAAGEMAAVGAAAGLAARGLSGSDEGSGSHAQSHDSISNTSQTNRSGGNTVAVQAFAEGGLITQPTLGLFAERKRGDREAVLPLDNKKAMKDIGSAIGEHGGNHAVFNINGGLISDHNVLKLMGKMSKLVLQGKGQLHASNSLRVTKRSI